MWGLTGRRSAGVKDATCVRTAHYKVTWYFTPSRPLQLYQDDVLHRPKTQSWSVMVFETNNTGTCFVCVTIVFGQPAGLFSSVQFNMVSMRSEKSIYAPPRLSEVSPTLPWKWLKFGLVFVRRSWLAELSHLVETIGVLWCSVMDYFF